MPNVQVQHPTLKPAVAAAIAALRAQYPACAVLVKEDAQGGAFVIVEHVDLGAIYTAATRTTWIGFHISFQYPFADVYPHHVRSDLARTDGRALGSGMQMTQVPGFERPSVQLSRRSSRRDATIETAVHKLLKVVAWASTHTGQ
jgi:hypothetical protein